LNYASNLLDNVDSLAKDNLKDKEAIHSAIEKRRNRAKEGASIASEVPKNLTTFNQISPCSSEQVIDLEHGSEEVGSNEESEKNYEQKITQFFSVSPKEVTKEAQNIEKEIENLCLELEFMEEKLKGQELELKAANEKFLFEREKSSQISVKLHEQIEKLQSERSKEENDFINAIASKDQILNALSAEIANLNESNLNLKNQLKELAYSSENGLVEVEKEKQKAEEIRKEGILTAQSALAQLREIENKAFIEKENAEKAILAARARQQKLEAENSNMYKEIVLLQKDLEDAKKENKRENSSSKKDDSRQIFALKEKLFQTEKRVKEMETSELKMNKEMEKKEMDLKKANSSLEQRLEELAVKSDKLNKELTELKGIKTDPKNMVSEETQAKMRSLSSQILRRQKIIDELTSERATLLTKLKMAERKAGEAKHSAVDLEKGNVDSRQQKMKQRNKPQIVEKVVRAADMIDRLSFTAGRFLKNIPAARAIFLIYLIFLHVWLCFLIGFSSQVLTEE